MAVRIPLLDKFIKDQVSRASILLAVFYLLSRLAGLFRDHILAARFGAADLLDVYYVAFNIPDLVFNLLVAGAISSAFIPVFVEYQKKEPGKEWALTGNFLKFLLLVVLAVSAVLWFFLPRLMVLAAPGFSPEKRELAVLFTRVILASPLIFSVSVVIGSLLQVFHRFLAFAAAPIFYNLGIIFGATVLEPRFGPLGLAEGVILGALLHLAVQLPSVWRVGWRWRFTPGLFKGWQDSGLRKIFELTLPRALGLAALQIYAIVEDALGSTVGKGTVAVFNFANNLQYLPIALLGISVAVASFPTLSCEALAESRRSEGSGSRPQASGEKGEFIARLDKHLRQIIFLIIPASFLFWFLRGEAVRIVLRAGHFSVSDASLTAQVLGWFMLGVAAQSLIPILSRAFYALQNTKIPVAASLISVLVNTAAAFYFVKNLGLGARGLALAFSLAGLVNVIFLLFFLKRKVASFNFGLLGRYIFKVGTASVTMFAVLQLASVSGFLMTGGIFSAGGGYSFGGDLLRGLVFGALALLTFWALSVILRIRFSGVS